MPRRGFIPKREVLADPIYNSLVVTKLINQVMLKQQLNELTATPHLDIRALRILQLLDICQTFEENGIFPI